MSKKCQNLTVSLISKMRDYFGVWEVEVLINGVVYTYPISSEYILKKVEKLLRLKKPGKALYLLGQAKISGFNSFSSVEDFTDGVRCSRNRNSSIIRDSVTEGNPKTRKGVRLRDKDFDGDS